MRIGELLLKRGLVEWEPLALAIADHRAANARIVSFLVAKGDLDFDDLVFSVTEVPVPGALALMLTGLAGFGFSRRRKAA